MRWPIHSDFWCSIATFRPRTLGAFFVFAAFVAGGSFSAQAQNLISNAQFTSPASGYGSASQVTQNFSYTVGGWTFASNASAGGGSTSALIVDGSGSSKTPTVGNSVQLTISDNTQHAVAATATLNTPLTPGDYQLTFEEYSHSSQHSGIEVWIGGQFSSTTGNPASAVNVGGAAASTNGFQVVTLTFTVTAAEVSAGGFINFELYQPSTGGNGLNAAFGNVVLTPVPEPKSSLGIAILFAGIACTVERQRMKAAFLWLRNRLMRQARGV